MLGLLGAGSTWCWGGRDPPSLTYLKPRPPAAAFQSPWGSQDLCVSPLHPNTCHRSSEPPAQGSQHPLSRPSQGGPHTRISSTPDLLNPKSGGGHLTGSGWGPWSLLTAPLSCHNIMLARAPQTPLASGPRPNMALSGKTSGLPAFPGKVHLPL